jgi:5-methyltetrahydropteroyltriglutamate--homocysteine methyltransferase
LADDDARPGTFRALSNVPEDKTVVLGLVGTKHPKLEDPDILVNRVREAAKFHAIEQLAVSTQCGFASSIEGNRLSREDQERKLKLVVEVARRVWG